MTSDRNSPAASPALLPLLRVLATALLAAMEAKHVAFGGAKVLLSTPATREEFDFAFRVVVRHFEVAGAGLAEEHGARLVATYAAMAAHDASVPWAMHAVNVFAAKFPDAAAQLVADVSACLPGAAPATAPAASEGVRA